MFNILTKVMASPSKDPKMQLIFELAHFNSNDRSRRRISYVKIPNKLDEMLILHRLGMPMGDIVEQLDLWE